MVRVSLLGPIEARRADGHRLDIGPPSRGTVLAALAEDVGVVVSIDALTERLWGEAPPATATNVLQGYVAKLRQALGEGVIETRAPGYVLHAETDTSVFRSLVARAETAGLVERRRLLDEALGLWRGAYLADVGSPVAQAWAERRVSATEDRIEADLTLGRSGEVVPELEELVLAWPWRERLRALLAVALHASGRRAEAARVLHEAREVLAEVGLEPGPAIADAERRLFLEEPARAPGAATANRFVGRMEELQTASALLSAGSLLTVVGPGGAGKTSLARELVRTVGGPSWFVDLAAVAGASQVPVAAAAALGVRERPDVELAVSVRAWAADHVGTVVLDNCEHVLDEAADLAGTLLSAAGGQVRVLATSRERLDAAGEVVFRLGPMTPADASELFRRRLEEAGGGPDDRSVIASLCDQLDHLPLALELAASRAAALGVVNVERRLDDRLKLLGSSRRTGRHASLRSLLDWSFELLDAKERCVFRRLAVFAGSFSMDAAERVCAADAAVLGDLVDKSLVHRDGSWFRLLETVARYAAERLEEAGEADEARRSHLEWCAQQAVLDESIDAEVRVALERARADGPSDIACRLARRAAQASLGRGRHSDAISRARLAVELSPDDPERGQGNVVLGEILTGRWRGDEAIAAYRAAVDAFERVGDAVAAARPRALLAEVTLRWAGTVSTPTPLAELDALIDAGLAVEDRLEVGVASELWAMRAVRGQRVGHLDAAEQAALRAVELAERSGDAVLVSGALDALSAIQLAQERYADAETTSACRVQLLPRLPATARGVMEHADILMMRSDCTLRVGDFRTALEVSEQLVRFEGDRGLRLAGLARLARVRFFVGRWDEALADVDSIVADWERQERPAATYLAAALGAAAAIRGLRGDLTAMREMLATARATLRWRTTHTRWLAVAEAIVPLASGRPDQALEVLRPAVEGSDAWRSTVLAMLAEASVAVGADDADERMAAASQAVRGDRYAEAILWRAAGERERAAAAFAALPCPWQASMTLPR